MDYDVLVVGSGIGGMESALKLGDMGYKVLVVEKEPSVGGKMILLSKVFPTLDCASCISTPKMAATVHHPNVTVFTGSEVGEIARNGNGSFRATVHRKPRFVDEALCTGCRQCELACTVAVPDQFNGELVSRRAAYIAFPQAVPQKALIERAGTSPCSFACPAGIKAHGYVSLVRSGEYEKAFDLVLEATPLVGSLGRACYAPCEARVHARQPRGPAADPPAEALRRRPALLARRAAAGRAARTNGKRVAIVGSGPAGLTAAWLLARKGYGVKIFEAAPRARRRAAARDPVLPAAGRGRRARRRERHRRRRRDRDEHARRRPRRAQARRLRRRPRRDRHADRGQPARPRRGARRRLERALRSCATSSSASPPTSRGKSVVVIGGGNVAIDAARSARRLGAAEVHMVCLESRDEMPAYDWEVDEALAEGVELHDSWGIARLRRRRPASRRSS